MPGTLTVEQAALVVQSGHAEAARERAAALQSAIANRPKLSADTAVEYLDWITAHLDDLGAERVAHHFTAAELAVRVHMGNAQAKATQHTLVQDGTIAPPPAL